MLEKLRVYTQYIAPQNLLTRFAGFCASSQVPWFKNYLIRYFVGNHDVNMSEAVVADPYAYASFNDFFTRKLKSNVRPISNDPHAIVSPVDGCISQIGYIKKNTLIQAKGFDFDLTSLLGGDIELANTFTDGAYATLYLAPRDYHRIHMPIAGTLIKTIYVPGKLFSVNRATAQHIPNLYGRNERLICLFETKAGKVAVILVGAMIVGSIQTVWMNEAISRKQPRYSFNNNNHIRLNKGDELGFFKLGSTVIMLFENDKIAWNKEFTKNSTAQMGQALGTTY